MASHDLAGEEGRCEGLDFGGNTWSEVVSSVGYTAKFSETTLDMANGSEMIIHFMGNSSDGHFCSQNANCTFPQNILASCCVIKLHILEWPFTVNSQIIM